MVRTTVVTAPVDPTSLAPLYCKIRKVKAAYVHWHWPKSVQKKSLINGTTVVPCMLWRRV